MAVDAWWWAVDVDVDVALVVNDAGNGSGWCGGWWLSSLSSCWWSWLVAMVAVVW